MFPFRQIKLKRLVLICDFAVITSGCGRKPERTDRLQWTVRVGEQSREQLYDRLRKSSVSEQDERESFILLVKNSSEFKISPTQEDFDLL